MLKERLLNALIVFLGVMASFAFYYFWQAGATPTEETHTTSLVKQQEDNTDDAINHISQENIVLPRHPLDKSKYQEESKEILEVSDTPYESKEEMHTHTQEIYDSLKPRNYEEHIAKANEVFESLDSHVRQLEEALEEQMDKAVSIENLVDDDVWESEEPYEMELPLFDE